MLLRFLASFADQKIPDFPYTTIQVLDSIRCRKHRDKNNFGRTMSFGVGDYTGGALRTYGDEKKDLDLKKAFQEFDGRLEHKTLEFSGRRITVHYFVHSKSAEAPPSLYKRYRITALLWLDPTQTKQTWILPR